MKHEPLKKHANHTAQIRKSKSGPHPAEYYCLDCNKHIAWMSKEEFKRYNSMPLTLDMAMRTTFN